MTPEIILSILPPWGRPSVPIGLGYISQALANNNIPHKVIDLNIEFYHQLIKEDIEFTSLWQPQNCHSWIDQEALKKTYEKLAPYFSQGISRLLQDKAPWIGFSVNQSNARITLECVRSIKQRRPEQKIILGGLGVYIPSERINLQIEPNLIDIFVMGEGEQVLVDLLVNKTPKEEWKNLPGVIASPNQLNFNQKNPINLKSHTWPRYKKFDIEQYPNNGSPMPVTLGRGCRCRCHFCGDYPFWGKYRSRNGQTVAEEIVYHMKRYKMHDFEFNDLAINCDMDELRRFCLYITTKKIRTDSIFKRNKIDINWASYAFLRKMSPDDIKLMAQSGCRLLRFGMESASDRILKQMNKPHRSALAQEVLADVASAEIKCNIGMMVGFPNETEDDIEASCQFIRENAGSLNEVESLSIFYMKPLSNVEEAPNEYGVTFPKDHKKRWNHWIGADGSTYETRVARAWKLAETIEKAGIKLNRNNIYGL